MFLNEEGLIVYFEFDNYEEDVDKRVGSHFGHEFDFYDEYRNIAMLMETGHQTEHIVSYFFDHKNAAFLILDSESHLVKLEPDATYEDHEDHIDIGSLVVQSADLSELEETLGIGS